ncbi:MAG: contractile injection system protein, VgrG/Pvc8 family, partial [Myxococcota bacterium]
MSGNNVMKTQNKTAQYTVVVAGITVTQADPKGLESLSVEDHSDMIGISELTFASGLGMDWSGIQMGDEVSVSLGNSDYKVFVGVVTGLRHGFQHGRDTLTIIAMDPLSKLAASRQVDANFDDMTDSDVVSKVIQAAGAEVGQVDATTEKRKYQFQRNESALAIVRRLAARNGYIVRANEGKIDVCKPQMSDPPVEVKRDDLMSLDYTYSPRALPKKLTVYGWDRTKKQRIEGSATKDDIELVGGGTPSVDDSPIWQGEASYISDVEVSTQEGAKAIAVAELNRMAMSFLRGKAVVQGNGALHFGARIKFTEHQSGFNPEGVVMSSRHRVFMGSGFTTELVFNSNTYPNSGASGGASASQAAASTPLATSPGGVGSSSPLGSVGDAIDQARSAVGAAATQVREAVGQVAQV